MWNYRAAKGIERRSITHRAAVQLPDQHEVDPLISADQRHLNRCCPLTPWQQVCLSVLLSDYVYVQNVCLYQSVPSLPVRSAWTESSLCKYVCVCVCVCLMCLWSKAGHWAVQLSLKSCSRSLPLLSSSALCPRNEQREEAQREEDKFLQGALSRPVVPCAALQQHRESTAKDKLKNAAVEWRVQALRLSLSLPSCPLSLSLAESVVIIQQRRAWGERQRGEARQSGSGVAV